MKAAIFDFDGVIADTEPLRFETYKILFLQEFNIDLDVEYPSRVGYGKGLNIAYYLKKNNLKGDVKDLINKRKKLFKEVFSKKENIKPIAGIFTLLDYFKKKGFKLALASASSRDYIVSILNIMSLDKAFDVIMTGDEITNLKPNPEIYLSAAKKLDIPAKDCLVFEDSIHGIKAAKSAGMKCCALTTTHPVRRLREENPDLIINSFEESDRIKKLLGE